MVRNIFIRLLWIVSVTQVLLSCASPSIYSKPVLTPATSGVTIASVEVDGFSANTHDYGAQLTALVTGEISRIGHVKVMSSGGEARLSGSLILGKIKVDSYTHTDKYKTENGTETRTTYYLNQ